VSFAPYEIPGSLELGRNLAAEFAKGVFSVILENHGACVAGASLAEAFARLEALDFCARTTINAHRLGKTKHLPASKFRRGKAQDCADETPALPCPPAEADLRYTAANLVKRAYRQQLFTAASGLLALRTDNGFIVNACGADRAHLAPEDFIPGDCKLLAAVFKAQPDVSAIALATPPSLMGYAVTDAVFDPRVIPESYILLREMPTLEANATDREIARTVSPRTPAILVRNRCAITVGKTALEAFDRLEVAEYSAKAAISACLFGGLRPIGKKEVTDLVAAFKLLP
jgi:L-fuculose-phosphate aldolase